MSKPKRVRIAKRDGTTEAFELAKLKRSLSHAMSIAGYDARYAEPLAKAVLLHLEEWQESVPPGSDYVHQCAKAVLDQTGLGDVADEFGRARRGRAARRKQVHVLRRSGVQVGWEKAELCRGLESHYGVRASVARIIGGEVEQRVLGLGYALVRSALVRELVRNEMLAWGLLSADVAAPVAVSERGEE
jgi:hypothetical protein